jgi:hypothetical protein
LSHLANPFVVILDANVLYPFRMRDVLLQFHVGGLYRARWTQEIMDEWIRSAIRDQPQAEANILSAAEAMRAKLPECWLSGYEALIPQLVLPDENDRHVLAAAIRCNAQLIVSNNIRDFPENVLDEYGIEIATGEQVLAGTFELFPNRALECLQIVRQRLTNPRYDPREFVTMLDACGMSALAKQLVGAQEFL